MSNERELAAAVIRVLDVPTGMDEYSSLLLLRRRADYLRGVLSHPLAETDDGFHSAIETVKEIPARYPVSYATRAEGSRR